jgi:hypothetical protein
MSTNSGISASVSKDFDQTEAVPSDDVVVEHNEVKMMNGNGSGNGHG